MTQKKIITNALLFSYIIISAIFTFIYPLDLDKHVGSVIAIIFISLIAVELIQGKLKKKKTTVDKLMLVGVSSLVLVYIIQYVKYGILVNVEALTLISIIGTIYFLNKIKSYILPGNMSIFFAGTFLTLSVLTINKGSGYVFETGAGGILSAFILLITFIASLGSNKISAKIISAIGLLLTIAISIRATLISVAILIVSRSGKRNSIIAALMLAIIILAIYIVNPESRIFALHTSGRIVHWEIIISKFHLSNMIYGMGAHSSTNILLELGLEESMAAPHNEYIKYIYDLGLLGAISLACILGFLYKSCPPENKALVFILALQMFTDNVFTYYFNYLVFFIILCVLPRESKIKKNYEPQKNDLTYRR